MMTPRLSKGMLTAHVTFSVGWFGTIAAFLALSIVGLTGTGQVVTSCYIAMNIIAWLIILPFCLCSLLTGVIQSLGTHWGLFKHSWIVVKLILTLIATILLLLHMQPISHLGKVAWETILSSSDLRGMRIQLIADAGAAMFVLLITTSVSVYKPWGQIQFGSLPKFKATTKKPLELYLLIGLLAVVILFIILHAIEGGMKY